MVKKGIRAHNKHEFCSNQPVTEPWVAQLDPQNYRAPYWGTIGSHLDKGLGRDRPLYQHLKISVKIPPNAIYKIPPDRDQKARSRGTLKGCW